MMRLLFVLLLVACAEPSSPSSALPTPTVVPITLISDAMRNEKAYAGKQLTTAGYLLVEGDALRLVDGLSLSAGAVPQPLTQPEEQLWIASTLPPEIAKALRSVGVLRYTLVVVRGRLEGPARYGPGGSYRYQMSNPDIKLFSPQETSISELLDRSASYQGRLVRVIGALLTRADSALLVERLGAGGVPAPKTRQLKLRAPLRDKALLAQLQGASRGVVRFGQVQVEGFWRDEILVPISIALVGS